mgnify:CR=1 FL=1
MKMRLINMFCALDQFLFCWLTLGAANPDETFSAAAWRWEQAGKWQGKFWRPVIDTIIWWQPNHCQFAFECERNRWQSPVEER